MLNFNNLWMQKARLGRGVFAGVLFLAVIMTPVFGQDQANNGEKAMNPETNLLFIHHSCGGTLLADVGTKEGGAKGSGQRCIYGAHPNGGGLRTLLEGSGYQVNELSYESRLGEDTDIEHWRLKFTNHMDELLRTGQQDVLLPEGEFNSVVAFKSCYPNNDYVGVGSEPGDPDSSVRTIANSKAAYNSLLPLFEKYPDVLFVAVSAPPRAEPKPRGLKEKITFIFKKKVKDADYAREFNGWLADGDNGWLGEYKLPNVMVFDYYDILTGEGESNWSRFASRDGYDSHPSTKGNQKAAVVFVDELEDAVEKMN